MKYEKCKGNVIAPKKFRQYRKTIYGLHTSSYGVV